MTTNSISVVLVDTNDQEIGVAEKLEAHRKGLLHRAFSIFVFNKKNEMLIHKRASSKYHSGGLWTNTCCSHPCPGETLEQATHRRLNEEMGFDCPLTKKFSFIYKVHIEKDALFEHELDHVFFGMYEGLVKPNPEEVEDVAWVSCDFITQDTKQHPEKYTYWFLQAIDKVLEESNKPQQDS